MAMPFKLRGTARRALSETKRYLQFQFFVNNRVQVVRYFAQQSLPCFGEIVASSWASLKDSFSLVVEGDTRTIGGTPIKHGDHHELFYRAPVTLFLEQALSNSVGMDWFISSDLTPIMDEEIVVKMIQHPSLLHMLRTLLRNDITLPPSKYFGALPCLLGHSLPCTDPKCSLKDHSKITHL
jgi:hypothetical protein